MDNTSQARFNYQVIIGCILLAAALGVNYFTIPFLQEIGWYPVLYSFHLHESDLFIYLPTAFDLVCIVTALILVRGRKSLRSLVTHSFAYNLFLLATAFVIFFGINGISPGRYKVIHILLILCIFFLLTNCLYFSVIRERQRHIPNFFKNMALVLYALVFIFLVLEVVFMFITQSHRYNGSLSSRSWFNKYYDLNSEGYRDHEHDREAENGKTKIMVLGDSFAEGHGVADPADRFSDVLGAYLPGSYQVHNLGKGGSDVRNALERLKKYPFTPDLLVYAYYPNDMENDCQAAGMEMVRIPHMEEVPGIFRYFVKRSYMINYIYWKFPHGSDLFNYRDYLAGCYGDSTALEIHLGRLDAMQDYADSLGIHMVTVIFPFLEAVDSTRFTAEPIVDHLTATGGYFIDVGAMLRGRPAEELIININDAHANEAVHKEVGDSLYHYLRSNSLL